MRKLLALLVAAAALTLGLLWIGTAGGARGRADSTGSREESPSAPPPELSSSESAPRAPAEVSSASSEQSAARLNGLSILLLDAKDQPVPDASITMNWRRGEGDYV